MIDSLLDTLLRHRRVVLILTVAWAIVIYVLSSRSFHVPSLFPQQDKAFHALLFGALGGFCALLVMSDGARPALWHVLVATLLVMGYGAFDEFHQSFVPGRTVDIRDVAADTIGGFCSALLVMILLRRHTS